MKSEPVLFGLSVVARRDNPLRPLYFPLGCLWQRGKGFKTMKGGDLIDREDTYNDQKNSNTL